MGVIQRGQIISSRFLDCHNSLCQPPYSSYIQIPFTGKSLDGTVRNDASQILTLSPEREVLDRTLVNNHLLARDITMSPWKIHTKFYDIAQRISPKPQVSPILQVLISLGVEYKAYLLLSHRTANTRSSINQLLTTCYIPLCLLFPFVPQQRCYLAVYEVVIVREYF